MVHALTTVPVTPATITTRSSASLKGGNDRSTQSLEFHTPLPCNKASVDAKISLAPLQRRNIITLGVAGALMGLNLGEKSAWAAARRPPPPPPSEEKKDPNVSGVIAKVLASKKRKEAMKEAIAKQRAKGKQVTDQE